MGGVYEKRRKDLYFFFFFPFLEAVTWVHSRKARETSFLPAWLGKPNFVPPPQVT